MINLLIVLEQLLLFICTRTHTFLEGFHFLLCSSDNWLNLKAVEHLLFLNVSIARFNRPMVDPHLSIWKVSISRFNRLMVDPHNILLEGFHFKVQQTDGWPSLFSLSGRFLFQGLTDWWLTLTYLSGRFPFQGSTDWWLTLTFQSIWKVSISRFNRLMVDPHFSVYLEGFYFKVQQTDGWPSLIYLGFYFKVQQTNVNGWPSPIYLDCFYFKVQQTNGWPSPFYKVSIPRLKRPIVGPHLSARSDRPMCDPHLHYGRFLF